MGRVRIISAPSLPYGLSVGGMEGFQSPYVNGGVPYYYGPLDPFAGLAWSGDMHWVFRVGIYPIGTIPAGKVISAAKLGLYIQGVDNIPALPPYDSFDINLMRCAESSYNPNDMAAAYAEAITCEYELDVGTDSYLGAYIGERLWYTLDHEWLQTNWVNDDPLGMAGCAYYLVSLQDRNADWPDFNFFTEHCHFGGDFGISDPEPIILQLTLASV